jgi:hypothetical protein
MSTQAWNQALCNVGAIGALIAQKPNTTQFGEAMEVNTMSMEWIGEAFPSNGSAAHLGHKNGKVSFKFDLHGVGDVASDAYLQTTLPALTPMASDPNGCIYTVNAPGLAMLYDWQTNIGMQEFERIPSELAFVLYETLNSPDNRDYEEIGDWRDPAILQLRAQSEQKFIVKLQSWWTHKHDNGKHPDALKLCTMAGSQVQVQINFDEYSRWLINASNDDWTNSALLSHVRDLMSSASVRLFCRYHFLERRERDFYQENAILNFINFWQSDSKTITNSTYSQKITFNFPASCILWFVRNDTIAFDDGQLYPGKIGVKDKFFFGSATGGETLTELDFAINHSSMIKYAGYDLMFLRTVSQKHAFGYKTSTPVYVLPFQDEVYGRKHKSFLDLSRFDNVEHVIKSADPDVNLFYSALTKTPMSTDYATVSRPFVA